MSPPYSPSEARAIITETIAPSVLLSPISLAIYYRTLAVAEAEGIATALVYDLLHCAAADALDADEVWTLNGKDFTRLQSVTNATVVVPPAVPA